MNGWMNVWMDEWMNEWMNYIMMVNEEQFFVEALVAMELA
jgi:hypothetical protein